MKKPNYFVFSLLTVALLWGCGGASDDPGVDPTVTMVDPDTVHFSAVRASKAGYVLTTGDVFDVEFLFEKTLDTRVKVRPDGYVALPVLGEVSAAGRSPAELDSMLTEAYATYYRTPEVTVNVLEFAPERVYVLGEVNRPRAVEIDNGMTLLHALAEAGGPKLTGNLNSVMVLRRLPNDQAYARRVNLKDFLNGQNMSFDFYLQPYDVIYVPQTFIARINQFVDQFFRQMIWVPMLYLRGWEAFHTADVYDTFLGGQSVTPSQ